MYSSWELLQVEPSSLSKYSPSPQTPVLPSTIAYCQMFWMYVKYMGGRWTSNDHDMCPNLMPLYPRFPSTALCKNKPTSSLLLHYPNVLFTFVQTTTPLQSKMYFSSVLHWPTVLLAKHTAYISANVSITCNIQLTVLPFCEGHGPGP